MHGLGMFLKVRLWVLIPKSQNHCYCWCHYITEVKSPFFHLHTLLICFCEQMSADNYRWELRVWKQTKTKKNGTTPWSHIKAKISQNNNTTYVFMRICLGVFQKKRPLIVLFQKKKQKQKKTNKQKKPYPYPIYAKYYYIQTIDIYMWERSVYLRPFNTLID